MVVAESRVSALIFKLQAVERPASTLSFVS